MTTARSASLTAALVLAIASLASSQTILQENFANLSQWDDLSRVVSWGGNSGPTSAFTASGGAVTLTDAARANSGYGTASSLKTFTALDYQFAEPIAHRNKTVTIDFRVRWEGIHNNNGEAGRFIVALNHAYPTGGLDMDYNDRYNDFDQPWWARPAYHVRIRNGNDDSWLQYGGGHSSLGEYEQYHSGGSNWWLGGFISGAGGVSPGNGSDFPANSWVSSNGPIASASWQTFRWVVEPHAQTLYVDREDGNGFVQLMSMPLPEASDTSAPLYQYFEQFEGIRLYWRGAGSNGNNYQAVIDSLSVTVVPEPAALAILLPAALALRRRRRTGRA